MKKILTIILISLLPMFVIAQSTSTDSKNWKHTGTNQFTKPINVNGQSLTNTKIVSYDAAVIEVNDTSTLIDAIEALPFLILPSQTTAVIQTLTDIPEPTLVYDITRHILVLWNGTEWRDITTTKSSTY